MIVKATETQKRIWNSCHTDKLLLSILR